MFFRLFYLRCKPEIVSKLKKNLYIFFRDIDKVLTFAEDCLKDKCDQPPELFAKLEQTYALLAFDNPEQSPFGKLMGLDQRNMLANEVNSSILESLKRNPTSKLELLFCSLVWDKIQLMNKGEALDGNFNNREVS